MSISMESSISDFMTLLLIFCLSLFLPPVRCQQLVNVALHTKPTQDGTMDYSDMPDGQEHLWVVSNSVDGQKECTFANYKTFSGTAIKYDPWWQLDLGSIYTIQVVHVMGRPTIQPRQLVGFRLSVGLSMENLSMVYRNNDTVYNKGDIWINNSMTARIIRIDLPKDEVTSLPVESPLALCEVEVYVKAGIKESSNVSQSSIYHGYGANLAIDRKYPSLESQTPESCSCCSVTAGRERPWWTIAFYKPQMIRELNISGRLDSHNYYQSKDLNIYISTTRPDPGARWFGELVWNIASSTQKHAFQYTFLHPRVFQYMSIARSEHGSSLYMTICEVDFITGDCDVGKFGDSCSRLCHCSDLSACDPVTGRCQTSGCIAGATGDSCECKSGSYGPNCNQTCGHCIDNTTCLVTNGTCPSGCAPGYNSTSDKGCNTACHAGHYGSNCNQTCGNCIVDTTCLVTNGTCPSGCDRGFDYASDKTCKTECKSGNYGPNCRQTCGHCIDNTTCLVTNGTCPGGCAPGYNSTSDKGCYTACHAGHYGSNCNQTCGNCIADTTCLVTNGTCPSGCDQGFDYTSDDTCKTECANGTYGQDCQYECGSCSGGRTVCLKTNGTCPQGECAERFTGEKCDTEIRERSGHNVTAGVVVGIVVLVVTAVGLMLVLKRRSWLLKRKSEDTNGKADSGFVNLEALARERANHTKKVGIAATSDEQNTSHENGEYYSFNRGGHQTNSIKVQNLWEYITKNRKNNYEDLFVEFQAMPGGSQFECYDAQRDENVGKNKYRNMYPYDHCRVKLKVPEGQTDYINASHVDGYERVQKFIAAQGPQKGTIEDFWLMVWQQGVRKVVMLTNISEMGKDKCEQYWPDEGMSIRYGGIEVTSKETKEKSDYISRKFEMRMEHEKLRRVDQFHFKSWPDNDVPDSTWSLVSFWRVAMNKDQGKSPIVVHCSAGIGRTGTFIALDSLYHQAMTEGGIRPVSVIETLRRQRINMVQTMYQYAFLHEAVADALLVGTHFFWASQLPSVCNFFKGRNPEATVTRAHAQFKLICECIASFDGQQQASSSAAAENIYEETGKPMVEPEYGNISTLQSEISEYRPKTKNRNSASIQQLNAIYLPNYAEVSTYILAETPSESSLPDFWSLVEEQNVTTIVNLTDTTHPYFQTSCTLGANGGKPVGRFVVNVVKEVQRKEYIIRSIVYKEQDKTENNAGFTVKMFSQTAYQQGAECPSDLNAIIALLVEVNKWHPYVSEAKPMLFICGDGRTRCGLVAAILNESQRMRNEEGHVNIVETVMTMKKRAGDVISTEQFQFLYEAVFAYALRMGYILDTGDYNNA